MSLLVDCCIFLCANEYLMIEDSLNLYNSSVIASMD